MKEKIFDIIAAARTGQKTVNEATNEVLTLFNVSNHKYRCLCGAEFEFKKTLHTHQASCGIQRV